MYVDGLLIVANYLISLKVMLWAVELLLLQQ